MSKLVVMSHHQEMIETILKIRETENEELRSENKVIKEELYKVSKQLDNVSLNLQHKSSWESSVKESLQEITLSLNSSRKNVTDAGCSTEFDRPHFMDLSKVKVTQVQSTQLREYFLCSVL
jgi:hypothetical protein